MNSFGDTPLLLCCLCLMITRTGSINIAIFLPGVTESDRSLVNKIAQHLAFKNHGVCTVKVMLAPEQRYLVKPKLHLVREVSLNPRLDQSLYEPLLTIGNVAPWLDDSQYENIQYQRPIWKALNYSCESLLNSDLMDTLRKDSIDVALIPTENPCFLAIVHALSIPFIYLDTSGLTDDVAAAARLPTSIASVPAAGSSLPAGALGWWNRLENLLWTVRNYVPYTNSSFLVNAFSQRVRYLEEPISRLFRSDYEIKRRFRYFPNVNEIKERAVLYFVNSDPLLEHPGRSMQSNVIHIAGAHLDFTKPLFEPWNLSIVDATDGIILVSFGISINASAMPARIRTAFLQAFSRLPNFRFFVKMSPSMAEIESFQLPNVNFTAYLPQQDLLASPRAKLLITHGGIQSIMEAMANGVPILGIPLWRTNLDNLRKVERRGFGRILHKKDISPDRLVKSILELTSPRNRYTHSARSLSRAFKDRPQTPFEASIHWIEFVGRHQGSKKIFRSEIRHRLFWFQYLLLDIILAAIIFVSFVGCSLWKLFQLPFLARLCKGGTSPKRQRKSEHPDQRSERTSNGKMASDTSSDMSVES